jgi:NAD-dependent SIR2 family protein deacetylase
VFEINYFRQNPAPFVQLACELWPGVKHTPTLGHYFIRLLHEKGKLLRCFTQNIDSLESQTGLPRDKIVAAHGNFDTASCIETRKSVPINDVKEAYFKGDVESLNETFGTSLVKPDIVFFG